MPKTKLFIDDEAYATVSHECPVMGSTRVALPVVEKSTESVCPMCGQRV